MNQKITFLILFLLSNFFVNAQYGVIDNTFNPNDSGPVSSAGIVGGSVYTSVKQPDDKILIGGSFSQYHTNSVKGVFRVLENGEFDATFASSVEETFTTSPRINRIVLLPNGKILVGGLFNIGSCVHLARLNSDGSLDPTFNNDTIFNGEVMNLDVLPDGRIVVVGNFSQCFNQTRNGIAILNSDGTLDNTFVPVTPVGCNIKGLCITQDNKILIGKTTISMTPKVEKLDLNGQSDPLFSLAGVFTSNSKINVIRELPNGKILVGGLIPTNVYSSTGINGMVKLNSNGSLVSNFNCNYSYGQTAEIFDVQILDNESILLAGRIQYSVQKMAVLQVDSLGVVANYNFSALNSTSGSQGSSVYSLTMLSDSTILIGGSFSISEKYRNSLMKLTTSGRLIPEFMPYYGANKPVRRIQKMENGQLMIGGDFSIYNGHIANRFARINVDGSIDTTFHGIADYDELDVNTFVVQSTGKIVAKYTWGSDTIRRYNTDGSLDLSFNSTPITSNSDFKLLVDSQDNIFYLSPGSINKLLADGSDDPSFVVNTSLMGSNNFTLLQNGKLLVTGNPIIRLNADGSLDNSFVMDPGLTIGTMNNYYGFQAYEDLNGKLIIGSSTFTMNGFVGNVSNGYYFRLNPNGSFDHTFKPMYTIVEVLGLLSDSSMMILAQIPGESNQQVAALKNDGSIDYRFPTRGFSYANFRSSSVMISDEKFVLAGYADSYDGFEKNNIMAFTNCFGPVSTDHITAYDNYTWIDGVNYTESSRGQQMVYPTSGCDSIVMLDLNIINPEINVFTTPSTDTVCSGVAYVTMTGIGPFTFIFQGNVDMENLSHTYTDLCPGIYEIAIFDALGLEFNTTFVIAAEEDYYFDDPFNPGTIIDDSLSVTVENCAIDYNTVYDAYIDSFAMIGQDSVLVYWAIVDSTNTTIVEAVYHFPDTVGNYYIQLDLFCSQKAMNQFMVATQGVRYQNGTLSTLSVSDNELKNLTLYPNPTNDQVQISFSGSDAELTIYDVQGKVMLKDQIQNQGTISLQNFERGVYLFDFNNSQGRSVQRVVKQ